MMVSEAKQRLKLLAVWGKDLGMNFGKLEKPNSTKICLDHKECFGNSLQMSGEKLEEQAVNIPCEMRENSTISNSCLEEFGVMFAPEPSRRSCVFLAL